MTSSYKTTQDKISLLLCCAVFAFAILFFAYKKSYNVGFATLTLISFAALFIKKPFIISKSAKLLGASYLLYFLVIALSCFINSHETRDMDLPSRYLIAFVILLALLKFPIKKEFFFYGIGFGAILACCIASHDVFVLKIRGFTEQMPIQAGDASMFFGLCSIIIYCYYLSCNKRRALFFLFTGITGILASLLSGSRGGWVLSPFLLLMILYLYRHNFTKKSLLALLSVIIIAVSAFVFLANPLTNRVERAISQTQSYFDDKSNAVDITEQSVGIRFELWKSAIYSFKDKPIFGWGSAGITESRKIQFEKGLITPKFFHFSTANKLHAHNEYFNELALRGIIGFASLLLLFGYPIYYFYSNFRKPKNNEQFAFAIAGFTFVVSIAGFCLTQVYIGAHNSGAILMSTMTVILFALVENEAKK